MDVFALFIPFKFDHRKNKFVGYILSCGSVSSDLRILNVKIIGQKQVGQK